jgi:hypothetical protein
MSATERRPQDRSRTWTGNIYAGLYYPIVVAFRTLVIGTLILSETKDRDISQ